MELVYKLWKAQQEELDRLVFLHGLGGTGSLWRPIAASLEDHYSILAPDQRAHGGSRRKQSSYTPTDFGTDVIETMEALEFHPAWLVGHSMGVRTATAVAHLRPEYVKGLILIDLGFSGPAGGGLGENLALFLERLPESFPSRTEARSFMNENCPDPSMGQYLMAVSIPDSSGRIVFPFDRQGLIATIHAVSDHSVRPWIREIAEAGMPILVLRGMKSLVWSKADFEAEKAAFADVPGIQFQEVSGAGHGLPFERRVEFLDLLLRFIQR